MFCSPVVPDMKASVIGWPTRWGTLFVLRSSLWWVRSTFYIHSTGPRKMVHVSHTKYNIQQNIMNDSDSLCIKFLHRTTTEDVTSSRSHMATSSIALEPRDPKLRDPPQHPAPTPSYKQCKTPNHNRERSYSVHTQPTTPGLYDSDPIHQVCI